MDSLPTINANEEYMETSNVQERSSKRFRQPSDEDGRSQVSKKLKVVDGVVINHPTQTPFSILTDEEMAQSEQQAEYSRDPTHPILTDEEIARGEQQAEYSRDIPDGTYSFTDEDWILDYPHFFSE